MTTKDKDAKKEFYGHPKFYEILNELAELHSRKNYQYATQANPLANFHRCGKLASKLFKDHVNKSLATALVLMGKQIDAVYEIVGEGKKDTIEELNDKLKDIAVYAIICIIINDEQKNNEAKTT
ncbi:MAG: hypothetical protein ACUVT3_13115 [Ignavibacterium sp.]